MAAKPYWNWENLKSKPIETHCLERLGPHVLGKTGTIQRVQTCKDGAHFYYMHNFHDSQVSAKTHLLNHIRRRKINSTIPSSSHNSLVLKYQLLFCKPTSFLTFLILTLSFFSFCWNNNKPMRRDGCCHADLRLEKCELAETQLWGLGSCSARMVWALIILFHHLCTPSISFNSLFWATQSQKWYCSARQWSRRDINYISGELWLYYRELWTCTVTVSSESPAYSSQQSAVPGWLSQPLEVFVWQDTDPRLQD